MNNKRYIYLLIFFLGFGIRLWNLTLTDFSFDQMLLEDANLYWVGATSGNNFFSTISYVFLSQTERTPGYFIFLAAIISVFGKQFLPILIIQSFMDALTCIMIMALGKRILTQNYWVFGVLAAIWPNLIIHSGLILTDTLFTFLFTCFLLFFVQLLESQKLSNTIRIGVVLGLVTLVRPVTQFVIILVPLVLPILLYSIKAELRQATIHSLVVFLVALSILSPILVKNSLYYNSFALTSQNGNHLQNWVASEVVMLRDDVNRSEATDLLTTKTKNRMSVLPTQLQENPFVMSSYKAQTAIDEIRSSPISIIAKSWLQGAIINLASPAVLIDKRIRKLPHISYADDTSGSFSKRLGQFFAGSSNGYLTVMIFSVIGSLLISLLQFGGFFLHFQSKPIQAILALLIIVYFLIINGPVVSPKYRLPLEPILIVWLGCSMIYINNFIKRLR